MLHATDPIGKAPEDALINDDTTFPGFCSASATVIASSAIASIPAGAIPTDAAGPLDSQLRPRLVVIRGERPEVRYMICEGKNFIGRTDEKPVDINLEHQEPHDRIWTSRQHAVLTLERGILKIEDLNSLNGTFVNRVRVYAGQERIIQANDVIQVGTVQLKLEVC
jgi:hypothetical protein